jgi:predicted ATPase
VATEQMDWSVLPARVEAVIAERMDHLSPQARRTLKVAGVAGETFVAEVLAGAQEVNPIDVFRRLDELSSEPHRLIHLQRVERLSSDGRRLSHYRFRHVLFQKFIYRQLGEAERARLHQRVGAAIEAAYTGESERLTSHAPQLAYHFQEAGAVERAIRYRQQAGEHAVRLSANEEAVHHFTQGLELIDTQPKTPQRDIQELQLLLALAAPLQAVRGYGAPETGRTYDRALALCQQISDMPESRPVLWLLGSFYTVRAEYDKALELYNYSLQLAKESGHALWVPLAHWALGSTLMYVGAFQRAAASLDRMVEYYDPERHHALTQQLGQDPGVDSLTYSAWILWFLGYPDQARERSRRAVALAGQLGHPLTQAFALSLNGVLHQMCRSHQGVSQAIDRISPIVEAERLPFYSISLSYLRGLQQTQEGKEWIGLQKMEQALAAWQGAGTEMHRPHLIAWLAEAYGRAGEVERGLALIDEALALAEAHNERYFEAEIHRLRGELLVTAGDEAEAEAGFQQAIDVARRQRARSWELRATTSLSRLWQQQGRREAARCSLESVYDWFSEGFDTPDLQDARSLLDELAAAG